MTLAARSRLLCVCLLLCCGCATERAEGRPWVRRVRFEGVKSVRVRDLARRLAVEQTSWLRFPRRYLDPLTVEIDRTRIEAFYRARGFFDAHVTSAEVVPWRGPKEAPTAVDVRFVVEEGLPTHIASVEVSGLDAVPEHAALEKKLHKRLPIGAVFEHRPYLQGRNGLVERLRDLGHAWAEVVGQVRVDRGAHEARITLTAQPGPVAHFGQVHIEGTERIDPRLVARHSGIPEGSRFDPNRLEDARGLLYNLGVFSAVRVDYAPSEQDPTAADVTVRVRESTLHELRLGVGLGLDSYRTDVHALVGYTFRNWLGKLRTLTLRLEPAWAAVPAFWNVDRNGPALLAEAQLSQPDWPLKLGRLDFTVGYDVGVDYAYQYHGPRTSLALQRGFWHENVILGASYHFQFLQFFDTDPEILDNPDIAGRFFGYTNPYRLGWFQQDVALDLRDQPLDPHAGIYAAVRFEEGGPWAGGAFQYEKIVPDLRLYAPLGSRVTLAGRFLFGQLFSQGDLGSPTTRRFYLGGPNNHRGFNYDRLSPAVPSGEAGTPAIPIGGDQMVLVSADLQVDVVHLWKGWVALAGFVDGGDVGGPSCAGSTSCSSASLRTSVDWGDLNWAVGGGVRYRTPFGALRFDVGVRLNRLTPTEPDGTPNADPGQRVAFHLALGEVF